MTSWKGQLGAIRDITQRFSDILDEPSFFNRHEGWENYKKLRDIKGSEGTYYAAVRAQIVAVAGGNIKVLKN